MDCDTPHSRRWRLEVIGWITEYPSTNLHMNSARCYMPRSLILQLVISEIICIMRDQCKHKIHYANNLEATTSKHTHRGCPLRKCLKQTQQQRRNEKKECVCGVCVCVCVCVEGGLGGLKTELEIPFLSALRPLYLLKFWFSICWQLRWDEAVKNDSIVLVGGIVTTETVHRQMINKICKTGRIK